MYIHVVWCLALRCMSMSPCGNCHVHMYTYTAFTSTVDVLMYNTYMYVHLYMGYCTYM